ncbi:hypothetical protein H6G33_18670 [Calothrix sp. FACHB-1219]|uniref:hypothetical protein n=1 Tax=unclassified Calothrix TaxID=2619626 RepID=UPI0016889BA6|nr:MULTISPECIES: hypothetical protein [unclassified Calothrix]MBD2203456.1 hypothetical protein [Calothrix sp. FACHB-168]MBD2219048.1 hypothetical protein [Calothrix sp. FACHB-1219]
MLLLRCSRYIKTTVFGFSTALFMLGNTAVNAQQQLPSLTPAQTQQLSRDLVPHSSQDFFRQGQELMEREIELLRQRQVSNDEPVLKVDPLQPIKENNPVRNNSQPQPN